MPKKGVSLDLAPVTLVSYDIYKSQIESDVIEDNSNEEPNENGAHITFKVSLYDSDDGDWDMNLQLIVNAKKKNNTKSINFDADIKIKGSFRTMDKSLSKIKIKNYLEKHGASELFSIIRVHIAEQSVLTPFGLLIMPSMSFK